MRENLTLRFSLFSLVLLLFLLFAAASALYEVENGSFVKDNGFLTCNTYAPTASGSTIPGEYLEGLWFRQIELYTTFNYIKLWQPGSLYNSAEPMHLVNTSFNNSYQNVYLWTYEPNSRDYKLVSSGILGYSMGVHNDIYLYYFADSWDISGLSGETLLNLSFNKGSADSWFEDFFEFFGYSQDDEGFNLHTHHYYDTLSSSYLASKWAAGFAFDPWIAPGFTYLPWTGDHWEISYSDYWQNNWRLYKSSASSSLMTFTVRKTFNSPTTGLLTDYPSHVVLNGTFNSTQKTLVNNITYFRANSTWPYEQYFSGLPGDAFPYYLNITDNTGNFYEKWINGKWNPENVMTVYVDTGDDCDDNLIVDTATTARVSVTNTYGIEYLVWKWSENWDDFSIPTSSLKKRVDKYVTYHYNATNSSTGKPWEMWAYGFEGKGAISTTSTTRGAYTWGQVNNQQVQFNWTYYEPSWSHEPGLVSPYNYVTVSAYDASMNFLTADSQYVCVGKGANKGQFNIWVMDSSGINKVYDANVFVFDTEAGPATWAANNVNASSGQYIVDVNVSHGHYVWASKVGYAFLRGESEGAIQELTAGCATYSIPFPGVKTIKLIMEPTGATNKTIVFMVWYQPDDLISPQVRVPNAKITLTSHQSTDVIYTDSSGTAIFYAVSDINYNYKVESSDVGCYRTVSGQFSSNVHQTVAPILDACSVEPTFTTTVTPTPTETYLPGPGEEGGNIFTWFIRLFQIAGAGTENNARLMLALVITSALAFIFGWYISFQASLIGAFIGFVMCIAFGLIPMWILISLIFIGGVFFVGKWWSGSDSGG